MILSIRNNKRIKHVSLTTDEGYDEAGSKIPDQTIERPVEAHLKMNPMFYSEGSKKPQGTVYQLIWTESE
jgi:glutamine cyclotransferase